jgi:hypothetical protein
MPWEATRNEAIDNMCNDRLERTHHLQGALTSSARIRTTQRIEYRRKSQSLPAKTHYDDGAYRGYGISLHEKRSDTADRLKQ